MELECMSVKCKDGYLVNLDPLDDVFHLHGVSFDDIKLEAVKWKDEKDGDGDYEDLRDRWAFSFRWGKNVQSFFVDTSNIKMNEPMRKALKKSKANNDLRNGEGRSAYE